MVTNGSPASSRSETLPLVAASRCLAGSAMTKRSRCTTMCSRRAAPLTGGRSNPKSRSLAARGQNKPKTKTPGAKGERLLGREHLPQGQLHLRVRGLVRAEQLGQHAIVGERHEADTQAAALAARHRAHLLHRALELRHQAPRVFE